MSKLEISTHPSQNSNVFASAGSGKTWLLIARICRLLLADVEPQHILAITFTRKSAAEMRARLFQNLSKWAVIPEEQLRLELNSIGEDASESNIYQARRLYEKLLFSQQTIRISTFHAFCEEVIRAFPLESELPTTFELTELSHVYANQAWQRLISENKLSANKKLRSALHTLFDFCFGLNGAKKALFSFLDARTEWRAFTKQANNATEYAYAELIKKIGETNCSSQQRWIESSECIDTLQKYYRLLLLSPAATYLEWAKTIEPLFNDQKFPLSRRLDVIRKVSLTQKDEPRKLTISKKWQKLLSEEEYEYLIATHKKISSIALHLLDSQKHARLLEVNQAWLYAGRELLQHYQHLKFENGVIDFADLEWETFRLLQHEDHALWVQYKLGQRIHHFLIDEFQDTSPIQWHLLKPLIESSHDQEQQISSSLFLVGDIKQSIYRFRGANPEIQNLAAKWSKQKLNSQQLTNNHSWRSSPAIINTVNQIFLHPTISDRFQTFQTHSCEHSDHWGFIKIHPLIDTAETAEQQAFRNSLTSPKQDNSSSIHFQEGVLIAKEIAQLIENKTPIYEDNEIRSAKYNDILILTQTRSHLNELKAGLQSLSIPIHSNDTNRLLDYLEVQDIMSLLKILTDPYDDLSFVHVLRSPIFNINETSLLKLFKNSASSWSEKLQQYNSEIESDTQLKTAATQLQHWKKISDRIPVHDLLNHIFSSWDVMNRYRAAAPNSESEHICNRLSQFLHQSLEIQSGRYPSIARFIRNIQEANPEVLSTDKDENRNAVEIMTVHGAKGLEAPIVFIADCGASTDPPEQFSTHSLWPANSNSPTLFMLNCKKASMSNAALSVLENSNQSESEKLNLLYVALTRAKQILIVSGVRTKKSSNIGWHEQICTALEIESDDIWLQEHSTKPELSFVEHKSIVEENAPHQPSLFMPLSPLDKQQHKSESKTTKEAITGTIIHKLLEILSQDPEINEQALLNRTNQETNLFISSQELQPLKEEALKCLASTDIQEAFKPRANQREFYEVSIADTLKANQINIVDKLIINEDFAWIIDFKTTSDISKNNAKEHAKQFRPQLQRYANTLKDLYPLLPIRCSIVFTKIPLLVDISTH